MFVADFNEGYVNYLYTELSILLLMFAAGFREVALALTVQMIYKCCKIETTQRTPKKRKTTR